MSYPSAGFLIPRSYFLSHPHSGVNRKYLLMSVPAPLTHMEAAGFPISFVISYTRPKIIMCGFVMGNCSTSCLVKTCWVGQMSFASIVTLKSIKEEKSKITKHSVTFSLQACLTSGMLILPKCTSILSGIHQVISRVKASHFLLVTVWDSILADFWMKRGISLTSGKYSSVGSWQA